MTPKIAVPVRPPAVSGAIQLHRIKPAPMSHGAGFVVSAFLEASCAILGFSCTVWGFPARSWGLPARSWVLPALLRRTSALSGRLVRTSLLKNTTFGESRQTITFRKWLNSGVSQRDAVPLTRQNHVSSKGGCARDAQTTHESPALTHESPLIAHQRQFPCPEANTFSTITSPLTPLHPSLTL